jgi:DNA (cytosine-5)-methyltransferase 3A
MKVLSLFDGMSCGQLALKKAGIKVDQYYASEIDKFAIKVTLANFPNTIQLGDVTKVTTKDLTGIDLLIGGSPCQSFSFAGKRKGMSTKDEQEILTLDHYLQLKSEGYEFEGQSYLFWEYMRILHEVKPKYFFLENVIMPEKWERILSKAIGVNGIHINSALLSAQNRKRIYWTNIGLKPSGLFGDLESIIEQPKDKGILLKDILETEVDQKYYLSEKMLDYFTNRSSNFNQGKVNLREEEGKASCLTSSMASCDISDNFIKVDTNLKPSNNQSKANCFTAGGNSGGLHSDMTLIVASRGRNPENPKSRESGLNTEQQLEPRSDGKTNCLTSVQKDNLVAYGCDFRSDEGFRIRNEEKSSTLMARSREDIYGTLMARSREDIYGTGLVKLPMQIRRLTPVECERLQTVPDNYTNHVSDSQRYKMLGNGWTVDVIAYIFQYLSLPLTRS